MATVREGGIPGTLLLDENDLTELANSADPKAKLAEIKAQAGLPAHAPHGVDQPEEWALPLCVEFDRRFQRREGNWQCVREICGRSTVYLTRHNQIG